MATGTLILPVPATLDTTTPPGLATSNSIAHMLFDDTTQDYCYWTFRMPQDYASAPVLKIQYSMVSATENGIDFEAQVMAVSDGDSQDLDSESYDTANSQNATVPGTAGYMDEVSVTLTNADSAAAGDLVRIKFSRDSDDGTNDTATGDLQLWNVSLEYTTS